MFWTGSAGFAEQKQFCLLSGAVDCCSRGQRSHQFGKDVLRENKELDNIENRMKAEGISLSQYSLYK